MPDLQHQPTAAQLERLRAVECSLAARIAPIQHRLEGEVLVITVTDALSRESELRVEPDGTLAGTAWRSWHLPVF